MFPVEREAGCRRVRDTSDLPLRRTLYRIGREFVQQGGVLSGVRLLLLTVGCAALICAGTGCRHPPVRVTVLPAVRSSPPATNVVREPTLNPPKSSSMPAAAPPKRSVPYWVPPTNLTYEGWVEIRTWAKDLGIAPPVSAMVGTNFVETLLFPTGRLAIRLGRQQAQWQGNEFWLALAPQLVRGRGCVHALDIQATLMPLLTDDGDLPCTNSVVVLDPGHGGQNPGAPSVASSRWEKEYTLDWALRLKPLLERTGWQVCLTRTNDTDVTLSDRVALADAQQAGLFLSLHFNHAPGRPDESGIETYCVTPAGLPSTVVRGEREDLAAVWSNNAFDTGNLRMAFRLHRAVVGRTGAVDRGVRRARFMGVLRTQERVAVLIEGGYLSNVREARLIASAAYRQALAEAVAEGLGAPPQSAQPAP